MTLTREQKIAMTVLRQTIERPQSVKYAVDGDKLHRQVTEDVEPVMERASNSRKTKQGWTPDKTMKLKGTIPAIFVDQIVREHGRDALRDPKFINQWFNEHNKFRASDGAL